MELEGLDSRDVVLLVKKGGDQSGDGVGRFSFEDDSLAGQRLYEGWRWVRKCGFEFESRGLADQKGQSSVWRSQMVRG